MDKSHSDDQDNPFQRRIKTPRVSNLSKQRKWGLRNERAGKVEITMRTSGYVQLYSWSSKTPEQSSSRSGSVEIKSNF